MKNFFWVFGDIVLIVGQFIAFWASISDRKSGEIGVISQKSRTSSILYHINF